MLAVALMVPATSAFAAKGAKKAKKVAIERCSGDKDVKSVSLGKEVVYVSEDLKSASFSKDEKNTLKHNLMYYSAKTEYSRRTPGLDKEGNALVPSFKHGDVWHMLSRDDNGNLIVDGAAAPATEAAIAPADETKQEVKKPVKKAKKAKKSKKSKKAKKVEAPKADEKAAEPAAAAPAAEPAPAAPAAEPAPAGK